MNAGEATVQAHYDQRELGARIERALRAAGKSLDKLTIEDLAPLDHFHSGGFGTTKALGAQADLQPGMRVLDVGSGIGGPARFIAKTYQCHVTGVDLSSVHCEVAALLSGWVGLQERTRFRPGSALALPFPDRSFDRVWTQNVQMNIQDKAGFYGEIARVLVPGGKLAFSDLLQGPGGAAHYPVPWAMDASISFLQTPESLRSLLAQLGFREAYWEDATAHYIADRSRQLAVPPDDPRRKLSIEIVLGDRARERLANGARNAEEQRTLLIQAVFEKTAEKAS
jgi:SAM-dependent methyltransferase